MSDNVLNTARWDDNVRQWTAMGGPSYSTTVVSVQSGDEQRAANWLQARGEWNVGDRNMQMAKYQKLLSFFHRMRGRFFGFRIRDWTDYSDDGRGVLGTGQGDGSLSYQMNKIRAVEGTTGASYQKITRPIGSTFARTLGNTITIYLNGIEVPQGGGVGSCYVDDSTGRVLFNPYTWDITAVTVIGVVTFSSNHNLSVGEWLTIQGFEQELEENNGVVQVSSIISSNSVQVSRGFTVGATAGATAANLPGPTDEITWTGQYDIPVRFNTDSFNMNQVEAFIEGGTEDPKDVWIHLGSIPVVQLRE